MRAVLAVEPQEGPIERIRTDLVIVGFAPEDRPLRRGAGRADWRLCGGLWNLLSSEKLSGARGEAALLSAGGANHRDSVAHERSASRCDGLLEPTERLDVCLGASGQS